MSLEIRDLRGHRVSRPLQRFLASGSHLVDWDGRDEDGRSLPSGVYFYELRGFGRGQVRKMLLLR